MNDKLDDVFTGKFVVVSFRSGSKDDHEPEVLWIENPKIQELGGRTFLIGRCPTPPETVDYWSKGCHTGVLWSLVESYLLFDTFNDYVNAIGTKNARAPERVSRGWFRQ